MDENSTQTWTLYDGSSPIADFNGSGSLTMRYLNGPAGDVVDAVLARQSAGGTIAWYLPDRLGTIRDLTNNSGSIIDHVDYSAFGTVLGESSPSNGDRLMGFTGMERATVSGLNLAIERVENPVTGRWDSQDPLGFAAADPDLYRYVGNRPNYLSDREGLMDSENSRLGDPIIGPPSLNYPTEPSPEDFCAMMQNPFFQNQFNNIWKDFVNDKHRPHWEQGRWVLWNPTTGQIGVTSIGVTPTSPYLVHFENPNIPGWVPIGTIHTHGGSGPKLGPKEKDKNSPYPGMVINYSHSKCYYGPKNQESEPKRWRPIAQTR